MLLSLCLMLATAGMQAQMKIAVMDFKAGSGVAQGDVDGVSAIFGTYFNDPKYILVERTQIDRVIDEQGFQYSALTSQQMVQIGEILNIAKMVVGDVNIVAGQYNVDVRVVNVETGAVEFTDGETWVKGSSYRELMKKLAGRLLQKMNTPAPISSSSVPDKPKSQPDKPTMVVTLLGYLHVSPDELGVFSSKPVNVIANINKQAQYGYDDWRLPTVEELELMEANREKLGLQNSQYMIDAHPSDPSSRRIVRLVTTGKSVAEKEADKIQQEAEQKRIAEEKRNAEEVKEQKIKDEPNTWAFEMANEDIASVEAYNKESACPSGWRLPTGEEMKLIVSNPYTKKLLSGNIYWIQGSSSNVIGGNVDEGSPDGRWSERYSYESTYYYYNAYNVSKNTSSTERVLTHSKTDAYTDRWGKFREATDYDVQPERIYHTCRCVRTKLTEAEIRAAEQKKIEEAKLAEQQRIEEVKKAEEEKALAEQKKIEEAKKAEEARLIEQQKRNGEWEIGYPNKKDVIAKLVDGKMTISGKGAMKIVRGWINNKYVSSVSMEDGITNIDDYAFEYQMELFRFGMGKSVTSIGKYAFVDCHNLAYNIGMMLPKSLTSIGEYAFYNCHNINGFNLPEGVKYIGEGAFATCPNNEFGMLYIKFSSTVPPELGSHFAGLISDSDRSIVCSVPDVAISAYKAPISDAYPKYKIKWKAGNDPANTVTIKK